MNVNEGLVELAEAIKATAEYSKLKQARSIISKNPNLIKEIEELSLSQKQLYSKEMSAKEVEVRMQQLKNKFGILSKNPDMGNYLKASNDFNILISKIYKNIDEHLEKGLKEK
ncbi:MAG: YlbF family regulator [Ignavibacteriales bacterium]